MVEEKKGTNQQLFLLLKGEHIALLDQNEHDLLIQYWDPEEVERERGGERGEEGGNTLAPFSIDTSTPDPLGGACVAEIMMNLQKRWRNKKMNEG